MKPSLKRFMGNNFKNKLSEKHFLGSVFLYLKTSFKLEIVLYLHSKNLKKVLWITEMNLKNSPSKIKGLAARIMIK